MSDCEEQDDENFYYVIFVVRHPALLPGRITEELGLSPSHFHSVGHPRVNPKGTALGGTYNLSLWSFTQYFEGERLFFGALNGLLDCLECRLAFTNEIVATSGSISITFQLSGQTNIGDELSAANMARMAKLGVRLGIEVFPFMVD